MPDLAQETRWPSWRAAAHAQGFGSAAALPRTVRPGVAIAVNLYAPAPHAWSHSAMAVADLYADQVARALVLCLRNADQAELNADLRAALVSRAVIDQAIGVIMAENRCGPDDAMTILRTASRHRKLKVRDVAASVVEGSPGGLRRRRTPSSSALEWRTLRHGLNVRVTGRSRPAHRRPGQDTSPGRAYGTAGAAAGVPTDPHDRRAEGSRPTSIHPHPCSRPARTGA